MNILQDKKSIINALAGLMNNPLLLRNTEDYELEEEDFPEQFHKIVFGAIYNLYAEGAEKIDPVTVDSYLANYPNQYRIFNENSGLEYLEKLKEIGEPSNFSYYYNRVKKYSLLRLCKKLGVDTSDVYDDTLLDPKEIERMQSSFDEISIQEIVRSVESKIIEVKETFLSDSVASSSHMADNIRDILDNKLIAPSYGANLASGYMNTLLRGARRKKFFLKSGDTGSGKSRHGLADLLSICVPEIWCDKKKEWIQTGATGAGVMITTELEEEEVKIPAICYIACVDEDKINDANVTKEEKERLERAIEILEKTNIQFEELRDFDIDDISNTIERNVIKHGSEYVVYDYIHQSLKMLTSLSRAGVKNLREDQIMLLMGIRLKDLCNDFDIWIQSFTQLNKNYKEEGNLDESSIRGGRALADKLDAGMIMLPVVDKKDHAIINAIKQGGFMDGYPTHTINLYKNRGNPHKRVRVWIEINMGNLRTKDLFVTDYEGNLLTNIRPMTIEHHEDLPPPAADANTNTAEDSLPDVFNEPPAQEFNF